MVENKTVFILKHAQLYTLRKKKNRNELDLNEMNLNSN